MVEPIFRPVGAEDVPEERISTGHLPAGHQVHDLLRAGFERYAGVDEGHVADYIPILGQADPALFGACLVGVDGAQYEAGDAGAEFSIQSVSKAFTFALVCEAIGIEPAREHLGVNATGMPFNSVIAVELNTERTMNPMVNAGAIAATSLMPGDTAEEKWDAVLDGLSRFAGRALALDEEVYASEVASNRRNRGIAHLLDGYGRLYFDAAESTDVYTRQCSVLVSARDLAVMGATLADGGVNPITGERVVGARVAKHVLAVLATAGLYERSGDWLYEVGLPGKSGVSGGILTVAPGKGGLGTYSPRLDAAGNSVRGILLTKHLSEHLGLNLFASAPQRTS